MGLLILCLAISSASAASHNINETSYSDYFNNDGSFKDFLESFFFTNLLRGEDNEK